MNRIKIFFLAFFICFLISIQGFSQWYCGHWSDWCKKEFYQDSLKSAQGNKKHRGMLHYEMNDTFYVIGTDSNFGFTRKFTLGIYDSDISDSICVYEEVDYGCSVCSDYLLEEAIANRKYRKAKKGIYYSHPRYSTKMIPLHDKKTGCLKIKYYSLYHLYREQLESLYEDCKKP